VDEHQHLTRGALLKKKSAAADADALPEI